MIRWLSVFMLIGTTALAEPCPSQPPRIFPPSGSAVGTSFRIVLLVRRENADAVKELDRAHPVLEEAGKTIPLKRDRSDGALRSATGELVFIFTPTKKLPPGTYRLGQLPTLPLEWKPLAEATWSVGESSGKSPELGVTTLGRTQCVALAVDMRTCRVTLQGTNTSGRPLLLEGTLRLKDAATKKLGAAHTFVEIIRAGEELALHNRLCDAEMAGLPGGDYAGAFRLVDESGRASRDWKTDVHLVDINNEMGKVPVPSQ